MARNLNGRIARLEAHFRPLADEADARLDRARALYVDAGDGRVDVEPAIRQVAAELGLDPDDVLAEARAILAEWDAPPGP